MTRREIEYRAMVAQERIAKALEGIEATLRGCGKDLAGLRAEVVNLVSSLYHLRGQK